MIRARAAAAALLLLALLAWLAYAQGYARSGERPLAWRDATPALAGARFEAPLARVVEDAQALGRVAPAARAAPLDFERHRYVLAASGPRSAGGYRLGVVRVAEQRGRVVVAVRERAPRLGEPVRPGVTYPALLVALPRAAKRVDVVWENRDAP